MTEDQKKEWLTSVSIENLIQQFETSVRWHNSMENRFGGLDKETLEFAHDIELVKHELLNRLSRERKSE